MRIGNFEFDLNRNGRPWRATAYYCSTYPCADVRRSECIHAADDPTGIVEAEMVRWYNESFEQMQDRIVTAQRLNS